jgi:CRISPR-associated protein Cmr5
MPTRDQIYAAQIFRQVSTVSEADRKKYGSMAHKLPILIRTAGLAQALGFLDARGNDAQARLLQHLAEVLGFDKATLLARSREAPLTDYMRLTRQAMAALIWYKRFAQSVLQVEQGEEESDT